MAKRPPKPPKLPPPTAWQCWSEFLKWVLGIPLVILGGLAIIGGGLWLAGGQELTWQVTQSMGTALFYIAGICLMYPLLIFMWVAELREGLKAARDWEAQSPEAQAAAIADARAAKVAGRETRQARRAKRKG